MNPGLKHKFTWQVVVILDILVTLSSSLPLLQPSRMSRARLCCDAACPRAYPEFPAEAGAKATDRAPSTSACLWASSSWSKPTDRAPSTSARMWASSSWCAAGMAALVERWQPARETNTGTPQLSTSQQVFQPSLALSSELLHEPLQIFKL